MGEMSGTNIASPLVNKKEDVLSILKNVETPSNVETAEPTHHEKSSVFDLNDTFIGKASNSLHKTICIVTLPLMTFIISLEIFFRYILGKGFQWSQEACCILLLLLCIGCQANCFQKDRHIRMDLIYSHSGKLFRNITDVLTMICGGLLFGCILVQSMTDIPYQISVNESTEEMYIPIWILNAFIVLSCACVVAALARYSFRMIFKK